MAAATAEVTSMPGVFAPTVAARMELILIADVGGLKILDVLITFHLRSSGKAQASEPWAMGCGRTQITSEPYSWLRANDPLE
jgi:hypothetical protein